MLLTTSANTRENALMLAVSRGHTEIVEAILSSRHFSSDLLEGKKDEGKTVEQLAEEEAKEPGSGEILKRVKEANKSTITPRGNSGSSALGDMSVFARPNTAGPSTQADNSNTPESPSQKP